MEILGIIPARGGSKGVPGKNMRPLAGKPLIAWTIKEAKKSKHLTRTIVSTDDDQIAATARAFGGEVPFLRPKEISRDLSTDVEFLQHALSFLKEKEQYMPDIVLRLPPTSPLRTAEDIDAGIEKLLEDAEADAARPVVEAPKPPFRAWKITTMYPKPFFSKDCSGFAEPHNLPRQLFPKAYIHTGAMDVMWTKTVREQKSTSGKHLAYFFMDPADSVNIDSPADFEYAEFLMNKRLQK